MRQLIEVSRPLEFDAGTGTYGIRETITGIRTRLGRPTTQTRVYSKTGVESTGPEGAMIGLLQRALADDRPVTPVGKGTGISTATARACERRGLGTCVCNGGRRYEITGFQLNAKGRAALTTPAGKLSAGDVTRQILANLKKG